jgi:CxxC motif-containing protein (DUF1111 family)
VALCWPRPFEVITIRKLKDVRNRCLLLFCVAGLACSDGPRASPGSPWRTASRTELHAFDAGQVLFRRVFTAGQGLGPTFNRASCSACHYAPSAGGAGVDRVRKATHFENERCDLLQAEGGDLFQLRVTDALRARGFRFEPIPLRANGRVSLAPPALYGAGAIDAIEDREILRRADPDDRDGDGISGRPGPTKAGRPGRFGRKSTAADLRAFIESSLVEQMGLTSPAIPREESVGGQPVPVNSDPARDPELDSAAVSQLTTFVQYLAFPRRDSTMRRDSTKHGRRLFQRIGCAACHTPALRTGPSRIRALNRKSVPLYSDLLLHDMGPGLAGVCAPGVEPAEWRTAPLVGLRLRPQLMHDGRVQTVESAVLQHGGEAESSRSLFTALSDGERAALLRFLRSL